MILVQNLKFQILVSFFFISMCAVAQKKDSVVLAEQKKVLFQNYPGVFVDEEINIIEKLDSKHSKIYYTRNNVNYETVINSNRKELLLIATCEEIPEEKLPAIVKDAFLESKYGSYKIVKSFVVSIPYASNFYRIDVNQKKKKIKSIFYTHLGTYKQPPY
jgi:hypothetical protein